MALRSRQKLWHKIAFSWATLLVLTLFMVLLTRGVWGMYNKNARAQARAVGAQTELAKVEIRAEAISKSLEYIKTTRGIEEELRRKFDVARDGEHLLVIVDKEVEPIVPVEEGSWLGGLWRKLVE